MLFTFYEVSNLSGVVDFAFEGTKAAHAKSKSHTVTIICALLTTFGGGAIFRDLILLKTVPAVLTNYTEVMLATQISLMAIMLLEGGYYIPIFKHDYISDVCSCIMDSLGLAAFICAGIDKAILYNASMCTSILCGIATGIGGGILASFVRGDKVADILSSSVIYRMITILGSTIYYIMLTNNIDNYVSKTIITILVVVACYMNSLLERKSFKTISINSDTPQLIPPLPNNHPAEKVIQNVKGLYYKWFMVKFRLQILAHKI